MSNQKLINTFLTLGALIVLAIVIGIVIWFNNLPLKIITTILGAIVLRIGTGINDTKASSIIIIVAVAVIITGSIGLYILSIVAFYWTIVPISAIYLWSAFSPPKLNW